MLAFLFTLIFFGLSSYSLPLASREEPCLMKPDTFVIGPEDGLFPRAELDIVPHPRIRSSRVCIYQVIPSINGWGLDEEPAMLVTPLRSEDEDGNDYNQRVWRDDIEVYKKHGSLLQYDRARQFAILRDNVGDYFRQTARWKALFAQPPSTGAYETCLNSLETLNDMVFERIHWLSTAEDITLPVDFGFDKIVLDDNWNFERTEPDVWIPDYMLPLTVEVSRADRFLTFESMRIPGGSRFVSPGGGKDLVKVDGECTRLRP